MHSSSLLKAAHALPQSSDNSLALVSVTVTAN